VFLACVPYVPVSSRGPADLDQLSIRRFKVRFLAGHATYLHSAGFGRRRRASVPRACPGGLREWLALAALLALAAPGVARGRRSYP